MTGKSPLSDQDWQGIHQRALAGESLAQLDDEFGYSRGSIRKMLTRRYGYPVKPQKPKMPREQSDAIYRRVQAGESLSAIARELGVNSSNLHWLMAHRYGYKPSANRARAVWAPTIKLDHAADTDLAYFAGIIDGEGTIMHLWRGRECPIWVVKVQMTDRPVIEWLHSFGGTFHVNDVSKRNPKLKTLYCWEMSRQLDVQGILTATLPYLIVKRARAEEALADLASGLVRECNWSSDEVAAGRMLKGTRAGRGHLGGKRPVT